MFCVRLFNCNVICNDWKNVLGLSIVLWYIIWCIRQNALVTIINCKFIIIKMVIGPNVGRRLPSQQSRGLSR